ncbi:MAG: preQ(1) synthase [Acidimicrobiaceae bacterium]|nr:preQ(1) synthase [Acidimicrobiaceae bacterium]
MPDKTASDTSKLTLLGNPNSGYGFDKPSADGLEVFDNKHPGSKYVVGLDCYEFTSVCPMTGQPDFGRIQIAYIPKDLLVESKSLKLYLFSYRNHGAFHEDCVNLIADDLTKAMSPLYLRVYGDFNPRGGIAIKPVATRFAENLNGDTYSELTSLVAGYDSVTRTGHR